ncbi:hypothetical protein SLEP1_g33250 [Rubroshorea leprosula]|uniref:Uncharacterized protein n=1 Tax=Rubroshorea leprosula TaxID=152421 RepID=A0AAV5KG70_9ROSI|nr:hypothetical protein SLEP1_g33250 [Rubroshorea leprosula]
MGLLCLSCRVFSQISGRVHNGTFSAFLCSICGLLALFSR